MNFYEPYPNHDIYIIYRSFSHRVHAATACIVPKYIFFKYLYLNNYKRYLYKILNIVY